MSVLTLVTAFSGPATERVTRFSEAVFGALVCALLFYIGGRVLRVSKQELRNGPAQLAHRRDQLEAWINKSRRDEDV